jgi:hypothetical protein
VAPKSKESMTPEQLQALREGAAKRQRDKRARDKAKGVITTQVSKEKTTYHLKEQLIAKSAKTIIANSWGISRQRIIDTIYEWGVRAAERLRVPQSDFFWANGPAATKASQDLAEEGRVQTTPKLEGDDNLVKGEVTYKRELFALYHFCEAWRENAIPTFEEYLAERRECKTGGTINRGIKYFGLDFHEKPHARWEEMYVHWNADNLEPDYDREAMKKWLGSLSEDKKRLLIACRSSYKSTFSLCFLVGGILCCPDIRLLFVTETKPLSLEFFAAFMHFFEVTNPSEPNRFNRLFPEFCVLPEDTSALKFRSPMSILGLPQPTCKTTSMESQGWAGNRCDYALISDAISSATVGTE